MIKPIWRFIQRHKKKIIGGGIVVGGGYVAYRVLKPKLQDYLAKRLMKEMGLPEDMLKDLLGETLDVEEPEQKRKRFDHNQEVADRETKKGLEALNERLISAFRVDICTRSVQEAKTKDEKIAAIQDLQIECLARSMTALYTLHLLLLLHRVEYNIVGREIQVSDGRLSDVTDGQETRQEYIEFVDIVEAHVTSAGLQQICEAMREAVKACWNADSIAPTTKVSEETLCSFLRNACRAADVTLLEAGKAPTMLFPESLDTSGEKVKKLLDEARDYVESPQFLSVFRSSVDSALTHFVALLAEAAEDNSRAAPLPRGTSTPIAKLGGDCVTRSQAMLSSDDSGGFVKRFGEDALVLKICEAMYFEDTKNPKTH